VQAEEFPQLGGNDAYDLLGVPETATPDAIKRAYRSEMRRLHPDTGRHADPGHAHLVIQANNILANPDRRRVYDAYRRRSQAPPEPQAAVEEPADPAGFPGTGPAGTPPGVRVEEEVVDDDPAYVAAEWYPPYVAPEQVPPQYAPPQSHPTIFPYWRAAKAPWSEKAFKALRWCIVPPIGFVLGIVALWEMERSGERGSSVASLAVVLSGIGMIALVALLDGIL
jgi:hypothetical protein